MALLIAAAMQAFDATIVNVALPQLEASIGGGIDLGSWVVTSYICAAAVMATLTGYLRRRHGARLLFGGALAVFVLASLLCAGAASAAELIGFRLIQGAAAGAILPVAQALLLDLHPREGHGRILAVLGATIMTGPMLGPVLGGVVTAFASWRWIFVLNVPLGTVAMLGLRQIPSGEESRGSLRLDRSGLCWLIIGVGALQLAVERSVGRLWPPTPETIAEAALAAAALSAIAIRSRRGQFTLLRLDVFRDLNFAAAAFYNFMIGALLFTTIVFLPALSEGPLGYGPTEAGLILSPRGVGTMAMMVAMRWLIDRVAHRALLIGGLLLTAAALALIAEAPAHDGAWWLAGASAMQGIGVGLLFTPLSTLAFSTLGAELRTDAAGVYTLSRQLGCAIGIAVMTAVLQGLIGADRAPSLGPASGGAALHAYAASFRLLAIATLALVPGTLLFRTPPREHPASPAE